MTDSDIRAEEWRLVPCKPIPGFSAYSAAKAPFTLNGVTGQILAVRTNRVRRTQIGSSGYPQLNVVDDQGNVRTRTEHSLVLLAWAGPCPPGKEASHLDDNPLNNRWEPGSAEESRAAGGNLVYETKPQNELRKFDPDRAAGPLPKPVPPPRPPKACVRCELLFTGNGKRCHPCVVEIGEAAAMMLSGGTPLGVACEVLEYPHPEGLHTLAVRYGGYGVQRPAWPRRVFVTVCNKALRVTLGHRLRDGDGQ
jgi:hypothetical protein